MRVLALLFVAMAAPPLVADYPTALWGVLGLALLIASVLGLSWRPRSPMRDPDFVLLVGLTVGVLAFGAFESAVVGFGQTGLSEALRHVGIVQFDTASLAFVMVASWTAGWLIRRVSGGKADGDARSGKAGGMESSHQVRTT